MESSSENSFAWTDTSSDSFNSIAMSPDEVIEKADENFKLNIDYHKKKKKKKSLSVDKDSKVDIKESQAYSETKSSVKKKSIKLEPESDHDLPKKKKKIKHTETNGNPNDSQDSMSYDETYLNIKVKHEGSSASSGTKSKQEKQERDSSIDSTTSTQLGSRENYQNEPCTQINKKNVSLKQETENETEICKSKKKKRKSTKRYDSDQGNTEIEDEMNIEETVVSNEILNKHSKVNNSVTEDNTLQDSEESDCDEISAIKCDEDHNLHTASFNNKSIEQDNTKRKSSDSLNEISISNQDQLAMNSEPEIESNTKSKVKKHRTQRISDRICFEDDEDDTNIESRQDQESDFENKNSRKPSKLKHFIRTNPNLKQLSQKLNNNSILTSEDEIWILKCPKQIDIRDFNNTSLNIHGKSKIKVGGQTYDCSAEEEQQDTISLLTMEHNKYQIKSLPLNGIIHLRKRVPKAHFRDDNTMVNNQTNFIPLPETKCRHPLFGSNYKKALKIPASIADRLNVQETEESSLKSEKRKKKKNKKDRNSSEQVDLQVQSEFKIKSELLCPSMQTVDKKKKKRKIVDDEGPVPKKVKRIKHDPESAEAWESERAIEENLFNF